MKIDQAFDVLKNVPYYKNIVDFLEKEIYKYLIDTSSSKDLVVFKAKIDEVTISFCLWNDDLRFSFFIESNEVLDDYIQSNEDCIDIVNFLKVIFSHPIEITYQLREKDRKLMKSEYVYFIPAGNSVVRHKENFNHSFNIFRKKTLSEEKKVRAILNFK